MLLLMGLFTGRQPYCIYRFRLVITNKGIQDVISYLRRLSTNLKLNLHRRVLRDACGQDEACGAAADDDVC